MFLYQGWSEHFRYQLQLDFRLEHQYLEAQVQLPILWFHVWPNYKKKKVFTINTFFSNNYAKWPKNRYIYKELRFQSLVGSSRISTGISSRVSTGIRTRSSIGACSIISLPRCCFSRNQNQNQNLNKQNKTLCTFFSHFYVLRNYILTNRQILNIVN